MQNYFSLENKGVDLWYQSQNGQRWEVFRLNNMAHNTLTINGNRHLVNGHATFEQIIETREKKGVKIDLTGVFANSVEKVMRTVYLDKEENLTVADEIVTRKDKAIILWIMVTPAKAIIISRNQMILQWNGRQMLLTVTAPVNIEMKMWSNDPINVYDEPNSGSMRLGFETILPAERKSLLEITLETIE